MAKASSMAELNELHTLITRSYTQRIKQDIEENIPTDAATLSGAVKFLKDNNVTADPAEADDLKGLRDQLKEAADKRRNAGKKLVSLVQSDVDNMMKFG